MAVDVVFSYFLETVVTVHTYHKEDYSTEYEKSHMV